MATPEEMSISPPICGLRRTETLPITKTTSTSTDGGGEIIMKPKKKRAGSFLCFGPPATDEIEDYYDEKEQPRKESLVADRTGKNKRLAKIIRSISMKSSTSRSKLTKDPSRLTSRKVSDSSENPLASESFGKNSDAQIFSSSSTSLSSSFSSSSSCSSVASSMAAAVLPKIQRKKSFLSLPGPRNHGYVIGTTMVLLSFIVMIFCGRLTAILWTATWLCLLPRRPTAARKPPEFVAAERRRKRDCCGEDEKKRVVMDGFLRRNRKGALD